MRQLTPAAMELLGRICTAYAAQPFEEGKEEQLRPVNLCRAEQKLAMSELQRAGLLAARQKIWGEKLYHIPVDQFPAVASHFNPYTPYPVEGREVSLSMEAGPGLAGELFRALLYTAREGLPLTAKGSIHKKNVSRLGSQLSFREEHLQGLAIQSPSPEHYPLPVAVAVDIMLSLGLISHQENAYLLEKEELKGWLHLPEPEMTNILYGTVTERYGSLDPSSQHFRFLISRPEFQPGQWNALSGILDWLEMLNPAGAPSRTKLEEACLGWLRCLSGFGWCELGKLKDGAHCFRWTAMKPQLEVSNEPSRDFAEQALDGCFIIQPDFEVLVPPEVSYTTRWTLAACAELLSCDVLWSFRLTREMLEHASAQGMPSEEVISWLNAHALGGLPEQVEFSLEHWGRGIGRTAISGVILLSCLSEEEAEAVAAHPRLRDKLSRLGPQHFSIPPEHEELVRKELAAAGMAPQGTIGGRKQEAEAIPLFHQEAAGGTPAYAVPPWEQGLLPVANPLRYLPRVSPEPEDTLLPDVERVPPMWSREWRGYHRTTAEKVMEQGLQWGVKVRMSLKDQVCDFIPSRILFNPWRVVGHLLQAGEGGPVEMELTAGEWKEMQLIIPTAARNSPSAGATGYVMIRKSTADGRTLT